MTASAREEAARPRHRPGAFEGFLRRAWQHAGDRIQPSRRSWWTISRDLARWSLIAIPIGVIAGLGAALFYAAWLGATDLFLGGVVGVTYPLAGAPPGGVVGWASASPRILLLVPVMTLGGLAVGWIAERWAPEVAGHGTDEAIRAFHRTGGAVRTRVPPIKIIASALTLGTGGSGGREGPAAQIGAGFGAWWSRSLGLSPREARMALASGLGAGIGAIFRAPLGGAIYSAEVFYTQDFEPEVLVPSIIASVISYSVFGGFYGFSTLFALPPGGVAWNVEQIPIYALLGLVCAGAWVGFVRWFHRSRRWFADRPWRLPVRVAVGMGLSSVAIVAVYYLLPWGNHFAALSALNVGYGFVQAAMLGEIGVAPLVALALVALVVAIVLRAATTSLTVGSGGAAGLFGTSVVIGALIGVVVGAVFHSLVPAVVGTGAISAFAIVGMMTFFGGVSKAPLAVLVMVAEMTSSYSLLVPAMLAIFIAYVGTGPYNLYSEQVRTRLDSPAHRDEYLRYLGGPSIAASGAAGTSEPPSVPPGAA